MNAINKKDEYTPLHYACRYGHADVATFLISKGAFVNGVVPIDRFECYFKPIHAAANARHFDVAELLVQNGADVSLVVGSQCGLEKVVQQLLQSGADVNAVTEEGKLDDCKSEKEFFNLKLLLNIKSV